MKTGFTTEAQRHREDHFIDDCRLKIDDQRDRQTSIPKSSIENLQSSIAVTSLWWVLGFDKDERLGTRQNMSNLDRRDSLVLEFAGKPVGVRGRHRDQQPAGRLRIKE